MYPRLLAMSEYGGVLQASSRHRKIFRIFRISTRHVYRRPSSSILEIHSLPTSPVVYFHDAVIENSTADSEHRSFELPQSYGTYVTFRSYLESNGCPCFKCDLLQVNGFNRHAQRHPLVHFTPPRTRC